MWGIWAISWDQRLVVYQYYDIRMYVWSCISWLVITSCPNTKLVCTDSVCWGVHQAQMFQVLPAQLLQCVSVPSNSDVPSSSISTSPSVATSSGSTIYGTASTYKLLCLLGRTYVRMPVMWLSCDMCFNAADVTVPMATTPTPTTTPTTPPELDGTYVFINAHTHTYVN